jgi:hypothetical protein
LQKEETVYAFEVRGMKINIILIYVKSGVLCKKQNGPGRMTGRGFLNNVARISKQPTVEDNGQTPT